jgi:hypothetical protein
VLSYLRLAPTGSVEIHTASTGAAPHTAEEYDVSFQIPGAVPHHVPLTLSNVPVTAVELEVQGIQALLGRDILDDCVLVYNGTVGQFTLAF